VPRFLSVSKSEEISSREYTAPKANQKEWENYENEDNYYETEIQNELERYEQEMIKSSGDQEVEDSEFSGSQMTDISTSVPYGISFSDYGISFGDDELTNAWNEFIQL
jgi:hypothetical protein